MPLTAVVVGGTSLSGGEGTIYGTLIGAFTTAVIANGMNQAGLEAGVPGVKVSPGRVTPVALIQANEPVLFDFWASWCGPCQAMNPTIEALAKDYKVCKVNVDTNPQIATHYAISSIPALLIFKGGEVASRHVGVIPEATLRTEMERLTGNR